MFLFGFTSAAEQKIAAQTLGLGLAAAGLALPIGGLIAWISRGKNLISRVLFLANLCLVVTPIFIQVSAWDAAFGRLGWLTSTEGPSPHPAGVGLASRRLDSRHRGSPASRVDLFTRPHDRLQDLRRTSFTRHQQVGCFWHITSRRWLPLIVLATLWTLIVCAREIAVTDLYQIGTLAEQIYLGYSLGAFQFDCRQLDRRTTGWTQTIQRVADNRPDRWLAANRLLAC